MYLKPGYGLASVTGYVSWEINFEADICLGCFVGSILGGKHFWGSKWSRFEEKEKLTIPGMAFQRSSVFWNWNDPWKRLNWGKRAESLILPYQPVTRCGLPLGWRATLGHVVPFGWGQCLARVSCESTEAIHLVAGKMIASLLKGEIWEAFHGIDYRPRLVPFNSILLCIVSSHHLRLPTPGFLMVSFPGEVYKRYLGRMTIVSADTAGLGATDLHPLLPILDYSYPWQASLLV